MSVGVLDLLARGRAAPPHVSALDAVMGEDWAEVEFDQARRARLRGRARLASAHREDVARHGGGSGGEALGRRPQAVMKMIRKGGASDLRGLRAQMAYLSRNGALPLERSERYMGVEVDAEGAADLERAWRMPPEGSGVADRTSHFLVSFPADTPHDAAHRAGRAWAEALFGSGDYEGDAFDYYTAFHTDRAHPHCHVVVHRRGLDHGAWLKVSKRSDLNYDAMRAVLVEVAAREGIALEATPRLARGVHDRPVPDAEHRRASAQGRAPEAPAHSKRSAILAAAALIHHARRFAADARLIEREAPEQAALLRVASESVAHGRALTEATYGPTMAAAAAAAGTAGEESEMSERVEARRAEVEANFARLDHGAEQMEDGAGRVRVLRQIAELKARTAPLMAEPGGLRDFQARDDSGRYQGLDAYDERRASIKAEADARVRAIAERHGVDSEATVERYSGSVPSRGLAAEYARAEARERGRARAERGEGPESVDDRRQALARMHDEIGRVYAEARARADRTEGREAGRASPGAERAEAVRPDAGAERPRGRGTGAAPSSDAATAASHQVSEAEVARWIAERRATERRDAEIARPERERREAERREEERGAAERRRRERDDGGRGL